MILLVSLLVASLPLLPPATPKKYSCGEKRSVTRPYGKVELRVDCDPKKGRMLVSERKGDTIHGISQGFQWPSGIRRDSCFFRNGKEHGTCLVWDSLGNVVGRMTYRDGKEVGKKEIYFAAGRPSIIKHFNDLGQSEGPWEEWWVNGNKKASFIAKRGRVISGTEYYPNGKPRLRYVTKDESDKQDLTKSKVIEAESWAPDGKSAGKIVNGRGEWLLFPEGVDAKDKAVYREVYRDSLLIKGERLDSAEVTRWFK